MKRMLVTLIILLAAVNAVPVWAQTRVTDGAEAHGSDSFSDSTGTYLFDELEYGDQIILPDLEEYYGPDGLRSRWLNVQSRLNKVGTYLLELADVGLPVWYKIQPPSRGSVKLRDIPDEGKSTVILTSFNKEQLAINSDDMVQLYMPTYEPLNRRAKVRTLGHEQLWTANRPTKMFGDRIRKLSTVMTSPALPASKYLARMIRRFAEPNSKLFQLSLEDSPPDEEEVRIAMEEGNSEAASAMSNFRSQLVALEVDKDVRETQKQASDAIACLLRLGKLTTQKISWVYSKYDGMKVGILTEKHLGNFEAGPRIPPLRRRADIPKVLFQFFVVDPLNCDTKVASKEVFSERFVVLARHPMTIQTSWIQNYTDVFGNIDFFVLGQPERQLCPQVSGGERFILEPI